MKKNNLYSMFAFLSMVMLIFVVIIHIRFVILPVFFLVLGLLSYLWSHRKALVLFLFLLPLINSTPDIFFNGYPFNYMGVALFYLSGIMIASRLKKEKPEIVFPGHGLYLLFLFILSVSVFIVFLRWSNLTLSSLAFLRDTPVAPSGERLSFACIFPVITLALFSLSPFLASLIRFWHLKENEIFTPLKAGFCLSFLLALVQKWLDPDFLAQSWWELNMHQVNGGFSDFNAFGFFAGAMFLYQALRLINKSPRRSDIATQDKTESSDGIPRSLEPYNKFSALLAKKICYLRLLSSSAGLGFKTWGFEILFLLIALAAIFISGCRAAFLFVLLAVIYLIFSRRTSFRVKAPVVLLLAGFLLVAGGSLKKRLQLTTWQAARLTDSADLFAAVDEVSSGRLSMLKDSVRMIARFPVSGIGTGNFLFYLKHLRFGETFYEDLPLNQYLLITSETGLAAGLLFVLFLVVQLKRQKPGVIRSVLAAIAFALFFNNFFWFPECLLLFWIFLAVSDCQGAPEPGLKPALLWAVVAVFIAFNVADFAALHPKTL
ncbi:MAG: O-antigen ligase family protein, partial [Acidobacteria bacterium]|nr:O-antigen ligase family protein [Acidobacteriota bacterium]